MPIVVHERSGSSDVTDEARNAMVAVSSSGRLRPIGGHVHHDQVLVAAGLPPRERRLGLRIVRADWLHLQASPLAALGPTFARE
jgi:hypothetical protein